MHTVAGVEEEEEEEATTITLVRKRRKRARYERWKRFNQQPYNVGYMPQGYPCEEGVCLRKVMDIIHRIWQPR